MSSLLGIVNKDLASEIGAPALLEQCAEECSELSQFCLKMSRVLRGENPTPKTVDDVRPDMIEEMADVLLTIDYAMHSCNIEMDDLKDIIVQKQIRWVKRYNESIKEEGE